MKAKIKSLRTACMCGCRGKDPWHKRAYVREIRSITSAPMVRTEGDEFDYLVSEKGTATFPWGEETVLNIALRDNKTGKTHFLGWERENYTT